MQKIDTVIYLSTTLNTGHASGTGKETIILPVLPPRHEEPQPTTQESMFSYVRLSDGGIQRFSSPRSEVSILATIGRAFFANDTRLDWKKMESHAAIRELTVEADPRP